MPALMPLGRQLELIISSLKVIAGNLLGTDLANSKEKGWAVLGQLPAAVRNEEYSHILERQPWSTKRQCCSITNAFYTACLLSSSNALHLLPCPVSLPCPVLAAPVPEVLQAPRTLPEVLMKRAGKLLSIKLPSPPQQERTCLEWKKSFQSSSCRADTEQLSVSGFPGEFTCMQACRRACPSLSWFFAFCFPHSLASTSLFYS